jgi:hypothetical protein
MGTKLVETTIVGQTHSHKHGAYGSLKKDNYTLPGIYKSIEQVVAS